LADIEIEADIGVEDYVFSLVLVSPDQHQRRWRAGADSVRSVERAEGRHFDALDPKHTAERSEVSVVVKDSEASLGGRCGDQVVRGRQPSVPAELSRGTQGPFASSARHRRLPKRTERAIETTKRVLVPRRSEQLERDHGTDSKPVSR
jgi:hypothetical protein